MAPVLQTDWDDFKWFLENYIPRQTIPILKQFADEIYKTAKIYIPLRSGERKQDITQKVQKGFQDIKVTNNLSLYARVRYDCETFGTPIRHPTTYSYQGPPPTFGGVPAPHVGSSSAYQNGVNRPGVPATNGYAGGYNNAGPSRPAQGGWQQAHSRPPPTLQDWKPNPMWRAVRAITEMTMLPDISANDGSHVRRERKIPFSIPNDVLEKLNQTKANPNAHPRYTVRLFCTSSDYYRAPGQPILPGQGVVSNRNLPIEYPTNPDITVDNYTLSFKEKGLRGKAGSAPPFDLEKGPNGLSRVPGRMLSVTLGHTGPSLGKRKDISKKFSYQIVFTEMTSKEVLLKRLNDLDPTSAQAALNEFRKKQEEDDDIVVGTSSLSLKDPLSYMRISRPIRSSKCSHVQCFDAQWWIESNAQHPQWLCPHCNKELSFADLIVDGYVLSILKAVPDSVDEVVMESNGDWHTEDSKYGSQEWMAQHGQAPLPETKPDVAASPDEDAPSAPVDAVNGKRKIVEILLSDSEDEEDSVPLAKVNGNTNTNGNGNSTGSGTRLTPSVSRPSYVGTPNLSVPSSSRPSSIQPANEIIDLTLSDSDEDGDGGDGDETNDDEEQQHSQHPFRQPGAGPSYPSVAALPRLPPLPKEDPVARPTINTNNTINTTSSSSSYTGAPPPNPSSAGGGRVNGAGIRPYPDFYDSDSWRGHHNANANKNHNNPIIHRDPRISRYETERWVPEPRIPPPSPAPPPQHQHQHHYQRMNLSSGSLSKRPRSDDWMMDLDEGPRRDQSSHLYDYRRSNDQERSRTNDGYDRNDYRPRTSTNPNTDPSWFGFPPTSSINNNTTPVSTRGSGANYSGNGGGHSTGFASYAGPSGSASSSANANGPSYNQMYRSPTIPSHPPAPASASALYNPNGQIRSASIPSPLNLSPYPSNNPSPQSLSPAIPSLRTTPIHSPSFPQLQRSPLVQDYPLVPLPKSPLVPTNIPSPSDSNTNTPPLLQQAAASTTTTSSNGDTTTAQNLSPTTAQLWIDTQNHNQRQGQGPGPGQGSDGGGGDEDSVSRSLRISKSGQNSPIVVQSSNVVVLPPAPTSTSASNSHHPDSVNIETNGNQTESQFQSRNDANDNGAGVGAGAGANRDLIPHDQDDDDDAPVRSSSLGLGEEEEFWDGVLNGRFGDVGAEMSFD